MKKCLLLVILLTGCANIPPAIENPPEYDIGYSQAIQAINNFKGAAVRWGGVIIDVQNEQTYSQLQVLFYPLGNSGRPRTDQTTEGRFLIKSNAFLDPAIYTKNTEVTVAGAVDGDMEQQIGNKTLRVPVVKANTIYLWPVYDPYYGYGYDRFYGPGRFGGIGFNSFYGYGPFYPYGGWYYPPYYHNRPPRSRR